jgi:deferrochelatase/peroxidase EfeB
MQLRKETGKKAVAAHHWSAVETDKFGDGQRLWRRSRARVEHFEVEAGVLGSGSCRRKTRTTATKKATR